MTENKRFTIKRKDLKYAKILENGKDLTGYFFIAQAEFICDKWNELSEENERLKQQLSDINGQLVMLDNCDNWDYDRMKHTVREIAEIIGYNGTINPKR